MVLLIMCKIFNNKKRIKMKKNIKSLLLFSALIITSSINCYHQKHLDKAMKLSEANKECRKNEGENERNQCLQKIDEGMKNLSKTNLRKAYLRNTDLINANLKGADLRNAQLRNANLTGADLTNARLYKADLRNANLRNANLTGVNLTGAKLTGAKFSKDSKGITEKRKKRFKKRGAVFA